MTETIAAFYKFTDIGDCRALRRDAAERLCAAGIKGTFLIAREGINATLSGKPGQVQVFLAWLQSDPRFEALDVKYSEAQAAPFRRLKVKIKPEIVTFSTGFAGPFARTGTYVEPEEWNAVLNDPETIVIDTRNDYEVRTGTFRGARDPGTQKFSDFPDRARKELDPAVHKKIAMFCTGGIRCEKASAYLLDQGFEQVFQLRGGILKYLELVPREQSLFDGECFVFDDRVSLQHGGSEGTHTLCRSCGAPADERQSHCRQCGADQTSSRNKRGAIG